MTVAGDHLEIVKLNERIKELEKRLRSCTCPPWYKQYLRDADDLDKDTIYLHGARWECPVHGRITT